MNGFSGFSSSSLSLSSLRSASLSSAGSAMNFAGLLMGPLFGLESFHTFSNWTRSSFGSGPSVA